MIVLHRECREQLTLNLKNFLSSNSSPEVCTVYVAVHMRLHTIHVHTQYRRKRRYCISYADISESGDTLSRALTLPHLCSPSSLTSCEMILSSLAVGSSWESGGSDSSWWR